jgi:hypothetical protein
MSDQGSHTATDFLSYKDGHVLCIRWCKVSESPWWDVTQPIFGE